MTNSTQAALSITAILCVLMPLAYKYLPLKSFPMVGATAVGSILISVIAMIISGTLPLSNLGSVDLPQLATWAGIAYGGSQAVYALLIQSEKTASAVTEPTLPAYGTVKLTPTVGA